MLEYSRSKSQKTILHFYVYSINFRTLKTSYKKFSSPAGPSSTPKNFINFLCVCCGCAFFATHKTNNHDSVDGRIPYTLPAHVKPLPASSQWTKATARKCKVKMKIAMMTMMREQIHPRTHRCRCNVQRWRLRAVSCLSTPKQRPHWLHSVHCSPL